MKGNFAARIAAECNDRDSRMKRWAEMSAKARRGHTARWERRLEAIRTAGFDVVEADARDEEIERLRAQNQRILAHVATIDHLMDGPVQYPTTTIVAEIRKLANEAKP
jgi:hypothetical protein